MSWQFDIIRNWEGVWSEDHMTRWSEHMDSATRVHVFFHPSLIKAWVDTYSPLRRLQPFFIWATHDTGACVFLPLVLWHKNWKSAYLKIVVPVGFSDFDYHDPIIKGDVSLHSFWTALPGVLSRYAHWDEIYLDGLHAQNMPHGWLRRGEEPCPFIPLSGFHSVDDYLATRSKKMRYNLRRQEKKAREMVELKFRDYDVLSTEEALEELPCMLEYHRQRWPHAYKAPHFHENLIREGLRGHILHFSKLSFNQENASWRIGFYYKGRYYSYMPTINPKYAAYGPGKVHLLHCIAFSIAEGVEVYDQLRGSELYKSEWSADDEPIYSVALHHRSISSKFKHFLLHLRKLISK